MSLSRAPAHTKGMLMENFACQPEIPEPTATITDRIRYLISLSRSNQARFAQHSGIDPGYLSRVLTGKQEASEGFINRLVVNLGVSKEWLMTGHDVPFPRQQPEVPAHTGVHAGAPVYDIDVTAGCIPLSRMFTEERIVGYCNLPGVDPAYPLVRVAGDSMQPKITPGSYISIRNVNASGAISWGQIYVVVLEDYRLVKFVRRHKDPEMVVLHSANPEYDDMEIRRSDIVALYLVEAIINYDQVC